MTYLDEMLKGTGGSTPSSQLDPNSSPYADEARRLIAQSGGDGRAAFFKLCQERGLNPQNIITNFLMGNKR